MNRLLQIFVFIGLLQFSKNAYAQTSNNQLWLTYNQMARVSNKWGYHFDANHRTKDYGKFTSVVSAVRVGAIFYLNNKNRFTGGYAWFGTYQHNSTGTTLLHENRLWQQWQRLGKYKSFSFFHRIRLEERWRQTVATTSIPSVHTQYTTRLRYMFQLMGPIVKPKAFESFGLNWVTAWEIMGHAGQGVGKHFFEQNRLIAGLGLQPNRHLELALLLQNTKQYNPAKAAAQHFNVLRVTLTHQLDLRRKMK